MNNTNNEQSPLIETSNIQKWLDEKYPKEGRDKVTTLEIPASKWNIKTLKVWKLSFPTKISKENLSGDLNLKDFTILKTIKCNDSKLTSLNLENLATLNNFYCIENKELKTIEIENCPKIIMLKLQNNPLLEKIVGIEKLKDLASITVAECEKYNFINQLKNEFKNEFKKDLDESAKKIYKDGDSDIDTSKEIWEKSKWGYLVGYKILMKKEADSFKRACEAKDAEGNNIFSEQEIIEYSQTEADYNFEIGEVDKLIKNW